MSDPFAAFGSDSDEEEHSTCDPSTEFASLVTAYLVKICLADNPQISLASRKILVDTVPDQDCLVLAVKERGFQVDTCDTSIVDGFISKECPHDGTASCLVPGGHFLWVGGKRDSAAQPPPTWRLSDEKPVVSVQDFYCYHYQETFCPVQQKTCPWLSNHSLQTENELVRKATVVMSSSEIKQRKLTTSTIQRAVRSLQDYGYCIIPQLLDPALSVEWGQTVLSDMHQAAKVLLTRDQVNILNPHLSQNDPVSYQELSMREDLRMDLRHGPGLKAKRGLLGNHPWRVSARTVLENNDDSQFLRGNADLLEIVRQTMNPKSERLSRGNFGRHNFGGSGPDGSYQDLVVGIVGGIVSLPGSADQAIHADTPHLFENGMLPAHYINAFTPGSPRHDNVGQTALVHGSHDIEFTAKYCGDENMHQDVWKYLVRPSLDLGDVLLFDCRILHFGLANTSSNVERPLLYTNMTMHWYHDPKNWDSNKTIFEGNELSK